MASAFLAPVNLEWSPTSSIAILNRQCDVSNGKVVVKPRSAATAFRTGPTLTPPTAPIKGGEGAVCKETWAAATVCEQELAY